MILDMNLLSCLIKARSLSASQLSPEATHHITGSHSLKILVLPREASTSQQSVSRLSITPPLVKKTSINDKLLVGFVNYSRFLETILITQGKGYTIKEAVQLKMLTLQPFTRLDKSESMLQAYHKMN